MITNGLGTHQHRSLVSPRELHPFSLSSVVTSDQICSTLVVAQNSWLSSYKLRDLLDACQVCQYDVKLDLCKSFKDLINETVTQLEGPFLTYSR